MQKFFKQFLSIPYKRLFIEVIIGCLFIPLYCYNHIFSPRKKVYPALYKHEDIYFNSIDNTKLNGWYIEPEKGFPTILFSHGNGGNISYFFDMLVPAAEKGYGVFIYDYRGYGNSRGFPYENGVYNDLRGAVQYLNNEKNTPNKNIILWGLSVGGAVTSKIAAENNFKAVILQSTFTNIPDMGIYTLQRVSGIKQLGNIAKIPVCFQKFDTCSRIDKIQPPILITHSKDDILVPYQLAVKNSQKNKNAKLVLVAEDSHNSYENSLPVILDFIDSLNK